MTSVTRHLFKSDKLNEHDDLSMLVLTCLTYLMLRITQYINMSGKNVPNSFPAKLSYLNVLLIKFVSRHRDPLLQVSENHLGSSLYD